MCNNHSEWKVSQKVKKQHQPQQHNTVSIHSLISRECREIYNLPPPKKMDYYTLYSRKLEVGIRVKEETCLIINAKLAAILIKGL